ncbi:hypothetical protein POJ06DRAFT_251226 [Lipomyces tetrasporus]|uniref:Selenoprotein O n=1 Tax=Lipomyces tetrasporus TaxID=54092 RepID=A0AAD7QTQ3_9ASCO|nr:uncharacterized protein POJ06DRAFT_251226 [Lipomyces tetrasporus]KAJ8101338.1 hypothetical protein POJ06DRAFT_251226 [Lipomyces tetrasporus]
MRTYLRPCLLSRLTITNSWSFILRGFSSSSMTVEQFAGLSLKDLPKSRSFTSKLPADPEVPTPESSRLATAENPKLLLPRIVKDGLFVYVKPDVHEMAKTEILAVSPAAMRDLGLKIDEKDTEEFKEFVVGNRVFEEESYPWAALYGGWQFGDWAGQLGDGRAISVFEGTNPSTGVRYEVQLKGAGRTPFSRFADGRAVLRSSIREFLVSEALNALSIPTTRALALSFFTNEKVLRERIEPRAIVARMAQSWLRIGSFDIHRLRQQRGLLITLADYCIEEVFGGVERIVDEAKKCGYGDAYEGLDRYRILYKEIVRRTAETTALWQVYGFMNGVLNTDNISVCGLSLDYGPFSFMDTYDPSFTPNHDDYLLRYSYRNTPTIMWWNLVRLGEDLAELYAVDDPSYLTTDDYLSSGIPESKFDDFVTRAENIIEDEGVFYKSVFGKHYVAGFGRRLGLSTWKGTDRDEIIDSALELMKVHKLNFQHFFRRLGRVNIFGDDATSVDGIAAVFLAGQRGIGVPSTEESSKAIYEWLMNSYKARLEEEGSTDDVARKNRINRVNPNFVLRNWILDEVIERVEKRGDRKVLDHVLHLALNPFEEEWMAKEDDAEIYNEEQRFIGDVPLEGQGIMCSCSS